MTKEELYALVAKFGVSHVVSTGGFHGLSPLDKMIQIVDGVLIQSVPFVDVMTGEVNSYRVNKQVTMTSKEFEYVVEGGYVWAVVNVPKPFVGTSLDNLYFNMTGSDGNVVVYNGPTRTSPVWDRDTVVGDKVMVRFAGFTGDGVKVKAVIEDVNA